MSERYLLFHKKYHVMISSLNFFQPCFRVNGAPSLGWDNTLAYLVLPVLLVVSQFVSMQLMQPKTDNPEQQQANIILKFLPIMIGWFSLNVPSALCVYWIVNNIVTTATTLWIRSTMSMEPVMTSGGGAATAPPPTPSVFSSPPAREKPSGFGSAVVDDSEVKPITKPTMTVVDAEIVTKEDSSAEEETEEEIESGTGMETSASTSSSAPKKVRSYDITYVVFFIVALTNSWFPTEKAWKEGQEKELSQAKEGWYVI